MASFALVRKGILGAFRTRWLALRPAWDFATQTAYPPRSHTRNADLWIKVVVSTPGGRNTAVGILDEVHALFTVDCYSRFDEADLSTMFRVDTLADDAHLAVRGMDLPIGVRPRDLRPQDFPITPEGYEHKRIAVEFHFDLDRVSP